MIPVVKIERYNNSSVFEADIDNPHLRFKAEKGMIYQVLGPFTATKPVPLEEIKGDGEPINLYFREWSGPDIDGFVNEPGDVIALLNFHKELRQAVKRLKADGYTVAFHVGTYGAAMRAYKPCATETPTKLVPIQECLSEAEYEFVKLVLKCPGNKLNGGYDWGDGGRTPPWVKPTDLGLITAVGSYRWRPADKLILAMRVAE